MEDQEKIRNKEGLKRLDDQIDYYKEEIEEYKILVKTLEDIKKTSKRGLKRRLKRGFRIWKRKKY